MGRWEARGSSYSGDSHARTVVPVGFVDLQKNCRLICWRIVVESWSGSFLLGHICEQVVRVNRSYQAGHS